MKLMQALVALGMFASALAIEQRSYERAIEERAIGEREIGARGVAAPARAGKEDMATSMSSAMPTAAGNMAPIIGMAIAAGLAFL
ncbi:hypothetical protein HRG_007106 [Hirsutella rhossiliensis]|uniref:Uncharacterized protein n=1 Tax=Hirsutella rhossiliensis TaxID=111463 RepID=A0A9P8SGQ1_9HYPO|nr:uncharacterized protein HRG_07106 [Hirsutella rhossiliensis]KAH0962026.1 hypothetical protein HRG_07106 [Hirsutella rhossiliensis]